MEKIVEYLDIFDRIKLAKTSRSLQTFVADQKVFHYILKLHILHKRATLSFGNSVYIEYVRDGDDCLKYYKKRETLVRGVAYWKQAILDFTSVLKNPKLYLHTLVIESTVDNENVFSDLEDAFKFNHHLNVKYFILKEYSSYKLPNFLPSLKPGYLTFINIGSHIPRGDSMNSVFEMEQWKQAKCFVLDFADFIWPLHHLYHFEGFAVLLETFSVENVRQMKEILFESSDFKKGLLNTSGPIDKSIFDQEFGDALREDPFIYHYPIPNSTDYFEIKVGRWTLEVQRQKS
ncbi:hypothetical protein CAEBREN_01071 [Caenorhabditis brenneri]|uniref:Uncharacterized protein n=1 Tax=Caenorhabditis brenneri TaxID=135651 RepID=G0NQP7_CAEBE|nr:hypothetical protein CAEBREN_01071 [Caenorhabditis brenneri]